MLGGLFGSKAPAAAEPTATASPALSIELFAPRGSTGDDARLDALLRDVKALSPATLSISGRVESSLASKANAAGFASWQTQLQHTAALTPDAVSAALDGAVAMGATSVLLLEASRAVASAAPFASLAALVGFIKEHYGASVGISVCGYPRGSLAGETYEARLAAVKAQVAAGATHVLAMPVLDPDAACAYISEVTAACPGVCAQPSVLPLHALGTPSELERVARAIGLDTPASLLTAAREASARGDWVSYGHARFLEDYAKLQAASSHGVHVTVLNSADAMCSLRVAVLGPAAGAGTFMPFVPPPPPQYAPAAAEPLPDGSSPIELEATPKEAPTSPVVHILHCGDLAEEIANLAAKEVPNSAIETMENFRPWSQAVSLGKGAEPLVVIFIVATVENEAPPEKAGRCVRFFNREQADGYLQKMSCATLGIGDSNLLLDRQTTTAKDCNQVAQRLDKRLIQLGATRFCPYAEADDRTGNTEVAPWVAGIGAAVAAHRLELAAGGDEDDGSGASRVKSKAEAQAARAEAAEAEKAEKERIDALASKWL